MFKCKAGSDHEEINHDKPVEWEKPWPFCCIHPITVSQSWQPKWIQAYRMACKGGHMARVVSVAGIQQNNMSCGCFEQAALATRMTCGGYMLRFTGESHNKQRPQRLTKRCEIYCLNSRAPVFIFEGALASNLIRPCGWLVRVNWEICKVDQTVARENHKRPPRWLEILQGGWSTKKEELQSIHSLCRFPLLALPEWKYRRGGKGSKN